MNIDKIFPDDGLARGPRHHLLRRWGCLVSAVVAMLMFPVEGRCQQSLFNVPAGLITPKGKVFAQEQMSLTQHEGESNTTMAFGLAQWLELGLNVLHVPMYREKPQPDAVLHTNAVLAHTSVSMKPASYATLFIGGAGGVGESPQHGPNLVALGWALTRWEAPGRWGSYVIGAYLGTQSAVGNGSRIGGLLGVEIPIVPERLSVMGDWVIGNNNISVAVLGLVAFVGPRMQISGGAQLPSPGSHNAFGGVLELTYVPIAETRGKH